MKKKIYVLKQSGFGAIAFNEDEAIIEAMYEEETESGKYSGFSVREISIPEGMFKLNSTDFWRYLTLVS